MKRAINHALARFSGYKVVRAETPIDLSAYSIRTQPSAPLYLNVGAGNWPLRRQPFGVEFFR